MPDDNYWCFSAEPVTDADITYWVGQKTFSQMVSGSTGLPHIGTSGGKKYILVEDNSAIIRTPPNASDSFTIGFRWRVSGTDTKDFFLIRDTAGSTMLFLRFIGTTSEIALYRGSTELGRSTAAVANGSYIELSILHHQTAGNAIMRVNGVEQFNLSGIDTSNTANTDRVSYRWQGPTNNSNVFWFTDFYESEGEENWYGPCVVPWRAVSADLSPQEFSLVGTSGDHYDAVNDVPADPDVGIESVTPGDEENFSLEAVSDPGIPGIVSLIILGSRPNSGSGTLRVSGRSGATQDDGDHQAPGDPNPGAIQESWALDPDTSNPWDSTGVDNFELVITSG